MIKIIIKDVIIKKVTGRWVDPGFPSGSRNVTSKDLYPEYNQKEWDNNSRDEIVSDLFLEIKTDKGLTGIYGSIDKNQAFIILHNLKDYLLGKDPLSSEKIFDQMFRMHRHGRSGLFMTAVSAVDLALWDLKGKYLELPIYRLLGGPTRNKIPAYASMLGFSVEPDKAAEVAKEYKAKGFTAQKWFFRHGPVDGYHGIEKNIAMAKAVREAVGPNYNLMFDAFMGWDTNFALKMLKKLQDINPTWMEEPVPPERIGSFTKLRENTTVPLATGEHVYTRWQVKELLVNNAIDYVQTDPDWTGGISELCKICALSSSFEVPVIAHGHSLLPALHVAAAQSPATIPYVEYLIRHQERKQFFSEKVYRPVNGLIELPDVPGLGIKLEYEKIIGEELFTNLSLKN